MLTVFTDSDEDVDFEIAQKYGFKIISMPYSVDGKEVFPFKDEDYIFDSKVFYGSLRNGTMPSTSALNPEMYKDYFEPEFKAGNDIFYIHFSRAMSGTFDALDSALKELKEKYPERKYYDLDTKAITIGSLAVVEDVADMLNEGKTPEEIIKWAETEIDKYAMYFFATDLKFFRRSGRVSGLAATFGTILHICPIIYMSSEGKMISIGKAQGKVNAMSKIMRYIEELGDDVKNHRVVIGHTDCGECANRLADMIHDKYGKAVDIEVIMVNPTAGSHCGPDGVGVCFHAIHR